MRPLLRRAIKVCRQERVVPPSVEIKMLLRHGRKACRQESEEWVLPYLGAHLFSDGRGDSLFGIGIDN